MALAAHERLLIVFSIHFGEGDSLFVFDYLVCWHCWRFWIVMHQAFVLDLLIDLIGWWLLNCFIDPCGGDIEV